MAHTASRFGRPLWVLVHRWIGLAMAGFLLVVGLSGSLLAFYPELQRLANPHWYPDRDPATWLSPGELAARVEAREPQLRVTSLQRPGFEGATRAWVVPRTDPATGRPYVVAPEWLVLDPASGETLAQGRWGALSEGWRQVVDFVYELHYSLALGMAGVWTLGIVALLWTIDCFAGAYLTLPPRARSGVPSRSWWARWAPAWKLRTGGGAVRLNFDLHRAGGLWPWALLLVFAWSSVYMNLWDTVYTWATRAVLDYRPAWVLAPPRPAPVERPALGWTAAEARARELMADAAREHGFVVRDATSFGYEAETGLYRYEVRSSLDIADRPRRYGAQVAFDGASGTLAHVLLPRGQYAGNTVSNWLYALHMGNVFGLPYRIAVCLFGVVVAMLSVTGVVVWWHKRCGRRRAAALRNPPLPTAPGPAARSRSSRPEPAHLSR